MHVAYRLLVLWLVVLFACTHTLAQQHTRQQGVQQPEHGSDHQQLIGTPSPSPSPTPPSSTTPIVSTGLSSASLSHTDNATSSATANVTRVSTMTPSTFPTASYASTGQIAGTAQAPFPGGNAVTGHGALGPDDDYIAAGISLVGSRAGLASLAATLVVFVQGGLVVL